MKSTRYKLPGDRARKARPPPPFELLHLFDQAFYSPYSSAHRFFVFIFIFFIRVSTLTTEELNTCALCLYGYYMQEAIAAGKRVAECPASFSRKKRGAGGGREEVDSGMKKRGRRNLFKRTKKKGMKIVGEEV